MTSSPVATELPRGKSVEQAPGGDGSTASPGHEGLGAVGRVLDGLALMALGLALAATAWLAMAVAGGRYIVDTLGAPEPAWVAGPLRDLGLVDPLTSNRFSIAILVLLGAWALVVVRAGAIPAPLAVGTIVVAHVLIVLAPPILSSDVFTYIDYARLGTVHGLNPYLHPPNAAPHDPLLQFVFWRDAKSPYGPLFTLGTYPLVSLGPAAMLWTLKGLAAAASLAVVALVWRGAAQRGRSPVAAALFVGLNPLALVYAVGGAHNDVYMVALLSAAVVAVGAHRSPALGGGLLAVAAAVKAPAAIVLPYLISGARRRGLALVGAIAGALAVVVVTAIAFGLHVHEMVAAAQASGRFDAQYSGPDLLARLLGTGVDASLRLECEAVAAAAGVVALVAAWRRRADPDVWIGCAGWAIFATLLALASFEPWYVVWVLPLAALSSSRPLRVAAVALTVAVVALHLPLLGFVPAL
jgi:hypothetical protein